LVLHVCRGAGRDGGDRLRPVPGQPRAAARRAVGLPPEGRGGSCRPATARSPVTITAHHRSPGRLALLGCSRLRHTGNALTAEAGANLRELMDRMGHSSTRAALIYLHSSSERQRMLADAVGKTARTALRKADGAKKASGTELARPRRNEA
jgi:hypothetical protein